MNSICLEEIKVPAPTVKPNGMNLGFQSSGGPRRLSDVTIPDEYYNRIYTDIEAIDNLFNGFIPGAVVTVGSTRGCGKTTLLMQLCQAINHKYGDKAKALYLSNEEDMSNLAFTAERIGAQAIEADNCEFVEDVIAHMENYKVMVVDSLAGLQTRNKDVKPSDTEVYSIQTIYRQAKRTKTTIFLVQHMRKGNGGSDKNAVTIGKSAVEHICDCCVKLSNLDPEDFPCGKRILIDKNRAGSCGEVWVKMGKEGFDFENGIIDDKSGNDKDARQAGHGGIRAEKKVAEMRNLLDFIKSKPFITEKDIGSWSLCPSDITGAERTIRTLKSMVKLGKVIKCGEKYEIVR